MTARPHLLTLDSQLYEWGLTARAHQRRCSVSRGRESASSPAILEVHCSPSSDHVLRCCGAAPHAETARVFEPTARSTGALPRGCRLRSSQTQRSRWRRGSVNGPGVGEKQYQNCAVAEEDAEGRRDMQPCTAGALGGFPGSYGQMAGSSHQLAMASGTWEHLGAPGSAWGGGRGAAVGARCVPGGLRRAQVADQGVAAGGSLWRRFRGLQGSVDQGLPTSRLAVKAFGGCGVQALYLCRAPHHSPDQGPYHPHRAHTARHKPPQCPHISTSQHAVLSTAY